MTPEAGLFEGSFGFDTFLCQLFRQPDLIAELNREPRTDVLSLTMMADAAHRMSDVWFMRMLTAAELAATRNVLLHERIHFWQMLSSSALQRQTLNSLAHLKLILKKAGAEPDMLWAGTSDSDEATLRTVRFCYESFNSDGVGIHWEYEKSTLPNDPATYLQRVQLGLDWDNLIEGYVADLKFKPGGETVRFLLVGRYLLESAAYVSEALARGALPERMVGTGAADDLLYRGAWELWCRANAGRYDDARLLAFSFLAAVDLAVNPELSRGPSQDLQCMSIPFRFGAILLASPHIPPLEVGTDESPGQAAHKFQKQVCTLLGWRDPDLVAWFMSVYLTQMLAPVLMLEGDREAIEAFCDRPETEVTVDELEAIWRQLNRNTLDLVGLRILRTMVNASIYRVANPGKWLLPHIYADQLIAAFPLPTILYDGEFYMDGLPERFRHPLDVSHMDYWSDCVRLITVGHLRNTAPSERRTCGFVRRHVNCPIMTMGAGCPKLGLSLDEQAVRRQTGLDSEWCHWKVSAVIFGLIPKEPH